MFKKYIIANWKMNFNSKQVDVWVKEFKNLISADFENLEIILAPSFLHMEIAKKSGFSLAAQDISLYDEGAHTGETGAFQIKEYCKYCIIGHSERGETPSEILRKRDECLKNNITSIQNLKEAPPLKKFSPRLLICRTTALLLKRAGRHPTRGGR